MGIGLGTSLLLGSALSAGGGIAQGLGGRQSERSNVPIRDPAFAPLQQQLIQRALGNLRNPRSVAAGIEEGGIGNINETFALGEQALGARLTSAGLGGSGVAGNAIGQLERGRIGQIGQFRSGIPLLEQQLQQQDFQNALNLFGQEPVGNVVRGNVGTSGLGAVGQGLGDAGAFLGFAAGQGLLNKDTAGSGAGASAGSAFAR